MGRMTETLRLVIDGDAKGAVRALGQTERASKSLGQKMNTAANYALGAGMAMAGAIGVSMRTATDYYENGVDTINDLTNLSSEAATRLLGQTKAYGIEATVTGKAVKFFERNLDEARQGTETYLEAFERLGFTQEELKTLTDEEILFRTRDAMAGLEDTTTQTAIALQLFGRAGAELSDWYDVAPDEIAKVNKKLEELGLVWGDKDIKTYQDMVDAQRDLQLTMLSLQLTIAKDVVPALTPLIGHFGKLLQALRPIMPAIPYLTAALLTFDGAVKAIKLVQFISGLRGSAGAATRLFTVLRNTKALAIARLGFTRLGGVLRSLPALLTSTGGMYGLLAAGIAIDTVLIIKATEAWKEMRDAIKQAEQAYENAKKTLASADWTSEDDKRMKRKSKSWMTKAEIAAAIEKDKYKSPWWAKPSNWVADRIGMAEGGTVPSRRGGTFILAAEAGEDEDFVPASKRAAYARAVLGKQRTTAAAPVLHIHIDKVMGTDKRAARELAQMVGDTLMSGVMRGMVGQNA